ncbi:DMT family transporter [Rubellimicrobium arenae]|uniref:DMT family transporter n=1 Tax=Rubellimicrobium arenae TaxID=2817372 RepID=UPI001B312D6C|nr:DMT family transporter [Rubellimicrobium arenae]
MEAAANRPAQAAALVVGAMALFGLIDNFMRLAAEEGGLWQFHFLRGLIALAILLPAAWLWGVRLRPLQPGRVGLRSVLNSLAMVIYFGCLGFMPIAQVVAGLFTAPLWVVLFSILLFGERVGPWRLSAVALGFAGVLLALGLRTEDLSGWSLLPVVAGALYGLGNLVTRKWCADEGTLTLLGGFFGLMSLWGALGCLWLWVHPLPVPAGSDGFITRGWVAPEGIFLLVIAMQAVGSVVGVGMSIRGYQIANATLVSVMENTLLVFATLWAIALWREVPGPLEALGLGLVTLAGMLIALREPRAMAVRDEV